MTNPTPHNIRLRKWILDKLSDSPEFEAALEGAIVEALGTVLTTRADLLTRDGTGAVRLAKGAQNTLLAMGANDPAWVTLSAEIDNAIGSTRGAIPYRGSSAWAKLDPGTSGFFLKSNGSGADPAWAALPAQYVIAFGSWSLSGTTVTFNSANALNVASVTRSSSGIYQIAFTSAAPSTNYVAQFIGTLSGTGNPVGVATRNKTTSGFEVDFTSASTTAEPITPEFIVCGK